MSTKHLQHPTITGHLVEVESAAAASWLRAGWIDPDAAVESEPEESRIVDDDGDD